MSAPARTFPLGRENRDEAWTETVRLAEVLVRHPITARYGVSRHAIKGRRGAWSVYLTDRCPELGPPSLPAVRAFRDFGLAAWPTAPPCSQPGVWRGFSVFALRDAAGGVAVPWPYD